MSALDTATIRWQLVNFLSLCEHEQCRLADQDDDRLDGVVQALIELRAAIDAAIPALDGLD
jgi:hypothetical protein